jgi:hypothetical protein
MAELAVKFWDILEFEVLGSYFLLSKTSKNSQNAHLPAYLKRIYGKTFNNKLICLKPSINRHLM